MPVPNRPGLVKKYAGRMAYNTNPLIYIVQDSGGYCEYQSPAQSCVDTLVFHVQNNSNHTVDNFHWSSGGKIVAGQGTATVTIEVDSGMDQTGNVLCTLDIDGMPYGGSYHVTSEHVDLSSPISITSLERDSGGTCDYLTGGDCVSSGVYSAVIADGNGPRTYEWAVSGNAGIDGSHTGATVKVDTFRSDEDQTFTLFCTVEDKTGTSGTSQIFTDTRILNDPIDVTNITRTAGGTSCVYQPGGMCAISGTYAVTVLNAVEPITYQWEVSADANIIGSSTGPTVNVTTASSKPVLNFTVMCTVTDADGFDLLAKPFTETRTEAVIPTISVSNIVTTAGNNNVCDLNDTGQETCMFFADYSATVANATGTVSYLWSATNDVFVANPTTATPTISKITGETTVFDVTCTVTDDLGSASVTQQFTGTVIPITP